MNSGGRTDKRQIYNQDRQQRPRGPPNDKNVHIEGVFKNQRLTHVIFSMVGAVVQVQVKNGIIYEGVLKTCSQNGDTVLDYAHMVEDSGNCGQSGSSVPSKERIIPKLIVKHSDLVSLTAANLDLDYAVKDSFTDTGISKYNGEIKDKEMRELQPWESEGGDEISLEGGGDKSSNGWDANDMFQTNAVQFNVQSSYDESLEQYTTRLERGNSEEYRRRELQASKLAAEIEGNELSKRHLALENGEGEDEESAFSSVVRPGESSSQPQPTGTGGPGKYIPPNKRTTGSGGMSKPGRGGYSVQSSRSSSGHQQSPPVNQASQPPFDNLNSSEVGRPAIPASTAGPTVKTSPAVHDHAPATTTNKPDHVQHISHASHVEGKKTLKGRDEQIKELKEFSSKFKLDDNKDPSKEKDKEKDKENNNRDTKEKSYLERKDSVSEDKDSGSEKIVSESKDVSQPSVPVQVVQPTQQKQHGEGPVTSSEEKQRESGSTTPAPSPGEPGQDKTIQVAMKSTLNPNAKEFVMKPFQPQATQQIPTPPRPHTQSPMGNPMGMQPQPVYPGHGQPFIMPPAQATMVLTNQAATQQQYGVRPKRAVVSMKQTDYNSAVQAATGQPLLAQSAQPYMYIQHQMMPPQPTGYQMGQVMPMPAAQPSGQRFMTPSSVQGVQSSLQHGMEPNNPAMQASQVYMTNPNQQGPGLGQMPSHFAHHNHIIMSTSQPQQQGSAMNQPPPTGAGHHHPAPSPVHSNPNQQSMNPVPHPPSSGTPQPPQGYSQATLQAHPHPQPSPHNPTSPQNMQPMHYPFNSHGHPMQMQGSAGIQQFSVPQQSSVPTSVTYSIQPHAHHSPHMQPQYVMMPPSASGQLNLPHLHSSHQFQGHHMPGGMQQQLMSQSGVQGMQGQAPGQGPHPHQMQHFIPQVHPGSHNVQNYQPTQ